MRRIFLLLLVLATFLCLTFSALAAPEIPQMNVGAAVSGDGSAQITVSVTVHLDSPQESLVFPVPDGASSVTLNGSRVRTHSDGPVRNVDLSELAGAIAGDFSFTVAYELEGLVSLNEAELPELHLPLLSGFQFPTRSLFCTVTLPKAPGTKPGFSSGYHQTGIEQDLSVSVDGNTVAVQSTKELKDHETLEMILVSDETMFPPRVDTTPKMAQSGLFMGIFAGIALLYWIFFLRRGPQWGPVQSLPPEGCTAGELRSILHLQGADLTAMVFSWAQLGYLTIFTDGRGRVMLRKQMDMENERSTFERRFFKAIFGKRDLVDATGNRYAELVKKVRKAVPNVQDYVENKSGNLKVFRVLAAIPGLFAGAGLGYVLGAEGAIPWFFMGLLAVLGYLACRHMQRWFTALFQPRRRGFWTALVLTAVWILLGVLAKQPSAGVFGALTGLAGGLLLAFGGRRTEAGRHAIREVVGLRRYLYSVSRHTLAEFSEQNPEYYYDLAPFAYALGMDRHFAKRFGSQELPPCPYLKQEHGNFKTAAQWGEALRNTAEAMDARAEASGFRKMFRTLRGFAR